MSTFRVGIRTRRGQRSIISAEGRIGGSQPQTAPANPVLPRGPAFSKSRGTLLLLLICLAGCATPPPPDAAQIPTPPQQLDAVLYSPMLESEYQIGVGDSLVIQSYYEPNLRQAVTVRPDGRISLVLLGEIDVAGKTAGGLTAELTLAYAERLDNPDINVVVNEIASASVYVGGEVRAPAVQRISGPVTLLQAITVSGGFLPSANRQQVLILRRQPDGTVLAILENAEAVLNNRARDIYLRRYDIVHVPKTSIAKADEFVNQYIDQIVPDFLGVNFGFIFGSTVVVP